MTIYAGSVNHDNVRLLARLLVSRAVQFLKGKSSHKILLEFPVLRKLFRGKHLAPKGIKARIIRLHRA